MPFLIFLCLITVSFTGPLKAVSPGEEEIETALEIQSWKAPQCLKMLKTNLRETDTLHASTIGAASLKEIAEITQSFTAEDILDQTTFFSESNPATKDDEQFVKNLLETHARSKLSFTWRASPYYETTKKWTVTAFIARSPEDNDEYHLSYTDLSAFYYYGLAQRERNEPADATEPWEFLDLWQRFFDAQARVPYVEDSDSDSKDGDSSEESEASEII